MDTAQRSAPAVPGDVGHAGRIQPGTQAHMPFCRLSPHGPMAPPNRNDAC